MSETSTEGADLERQREAQANAAAWREAARAVEAAAQAWLLADPSADAADEHDDYGNLLEAHWGAAWNGHYWASLGAQPLPERPPVYAQRREGGWWDLWREARATADRLTADMPRRPTSDEDHDEED